MRWVSPKRRKKEQVIKTTVVALVSTVSIILILATSHARGIWGAVKFIFLVDCRPLAHGVHPFFIAVIAVISSVFAYVEYREYRRGRYRLWPRKAGH
ncbi:MAG: hypothetical protein GXO65_01015 [Euryarchaeota archaeon]|nr:hypothetical protein [Euryarchaeota archaeon]